MPVECTVVWTRQNLPSTRTGGSDAFAKNFSQRNPAKPTLSCFMATALRSREHLQTKILYQNFHVTNLPFGLLHKRHNLVQQRSDTVMVRLMASKQENRFFKTFKHIILGLTDITNVSILGYQSEISKMLITSTEKCNILKFS